MPSGLKKIKIILFGSICLGIGVFIGIAFCLKPWNDAVFRLDKAKAIESLRGKVRFDYECDEQGTPLVNWGPDKGPGSLSERFGLGKIVYMDLTRIKGDEAFLERMLIFDSIKHLRLPPFASDKVLLKLHDFENLVYVDIDGTDVTQNGVDSLQHANPKVKINSIFFDKPKGLNDFPSGDIEGSPF